MSMFVIHLIFLGAGFVFLLLTLFCYSRYRANWGSSIVPTCICFLLCFCCCVGCAFARESVDVEIYLDVEEKLSSDEYVLYVDGRETDPNYIDIEKYKATAFTIDDENKVILLTTNVK